MPEEYKVIEEAGEKILKINYEKKVIVPSIEESPFCMAQTISILMKTGPVNRIIFTQREEYIYDESQTKLLVEIAQLIDQLVNKENILSYSNLGASGCSRCLSARFDFLRILLMTELREDPIGAYLHLRDKIKQERIKAKVPELATCSSCGQDNATFLQTLNYIFSLLSRTSLIKEAQPFLKEYDPSTRGVYKKIFKPVIRPSFLYTRVATQIPTGAKEIDAYNIGETKILILKTKDEIRPIYHITPPEFKLLEEHYNILGEALEIISAHKPKRSEFLEPERTREIFFNVEKDLLKDLFRSRGMPIDYALLNKLAKILIRYTIGFGIIEILLSDPKIQDISVNSPPGMNPITVIHEDYGECITNISITPRDAKNWATKLRLISGRPLDEANPVLDTELLLPEARVRVAAIQQPLSPSGIAFSFRRHRAKPWTLPLFIQNKMINSLAAGLYSFLIDGARTLLIAGTRSAGKTSLLGALMVEIMRANRIITVEDTLELPVHELKKLGYDIQSMKVRSVITGEKEGISAAEGIRTSLRMGDSCLIVGEVRSTEALALYEAMRVGALANVVAGTIHGDSPYGVFDRVVNDLGVPRTSFKATDIITICNPVKSASGLEKHRRVVQITEVRKEWEEDPLREKAFADLMIYNPKTDTLEPTDILTQGESQIIKAIASRVREWAGDWDAVWENIELRAKIKQTMVDFAEKLNRPEILEADYVIAANDAFHLISEKIKKEIGVSDPKKIYEEWLNWFKRKLKE